MQKHPTLTLNRIARMHQLQIKECLIVARQPLSIEFCDVEHPDEKSARKHGPWVPVQAGHSYGPAYRTFWFRITGTVPKDWAGKEVGMMAEIGGERTVWIGNTPERGIDGPHAVYRLADEAKGGEKIDLAIQVYSGNPSVRLIGDTPPRQELTETVKSAELVLVDTHLTQLHFDIEFTLSLMKTLPENDPAYSTLLRALNSVCNVFDPSQRDTIRAARKLIKDALGSLNSELKHQITAVGHAHLDTAWLWPLHITHLKMAHTTANQLYLLERYPDYVFVHSQASQYEWLEDEYPALFERLKSAIDAKRWEVVGSMWVEADCNITGGESLIRQFLYGRQYFEEKLGVVTDDMWLPDVFGYAAALPQILKKFGIKYFLTQKISWNQTNKFPHNTFLWKGIDGTSIWSHFPPADTYVGNGTPQEIIESVRKHKDQARSDQSLYIFGHGDGGGGPTEEHLELLKRGRTAPYMPEIELGKQAIQFFREAKARSRDLTTWSGELYLEMHRGTYTSQANNKKWNRQSEFLMRDAEWLWCFAGDLPKKYPQAEIERLWKLVLLNQFHDIIPGSSVREVYEDSDRDYADILTGGQALVDQALQTIGEKLGAGPDSVALFANSSVPSQASIPWEKDEAPTSIQVGNSTYPVQLIEQFDERQLIFETPEEAMGSVAVGQFSDTPITNRARLKVRERKIENGEWSVRFDTNGNITSITAIDDSNTEFVEADKLANVFQIFDDRPNFWGAWDVDPWTMETERSLFKAESVEVVERGPVRVAIEVVRRISDVSWIRQRISLGPTPGIRFDTEIEWREAHKLLKVAFPLNVNANRATYEIQFGHVERPTHQNTSWDTARFEVPAQKWVDVSQGDLGVALLNDSKYGFDCVGSTLRMSLLRAPKAPDPECDMGRHRFSYVLLPHYDGLQQSDVVAAAYALNSPLRHKALTPSQGVADRLPKLVGIDTRNLIIETVKKAERSNHIIVRLYECHNSRGVANLTCARPIQRAFIVNLEEREPREIELVDGMVPISYLPFEIITLMLEV